MTDALRPDRPAAASSAVPAPRSARRAEPGEHRRRVDDDRRRVPSRHFPGRPTLRVCSGRGARTDGRLPVLANPTSPDGRSVGSTIPASGRAGDAPAPGHAGQARSPPAARAGRLSMTSWPARPSCSSSSSTHVSTGCWALTSENAWGEEPPRPGSPGGAAGRQEVSTSESDPCSAAPSSHYWPPCSCSPPAPARPAGRAAPDAGSGRSSSTSTARRRRPGEPSRTPTVCSRRTG